MQTGRTIGWNEPEGKWSTPKERRKTDVRIGREIGEEREISYRFRWRNRNRSVQRARGIDGKSVWHRCVWNMVPVAGLPQIYTRTLLFPTAYAVAPYFTHTDAHFVIRANLIAPRHRWPLTGIELSAMPLPDTRRNFCKRIPTRTQSWLTLASTLKMIELTG